MGDEDPPSNNPTSNNKDPFAMRRSVTPPLPLSSMNGTKGQPEERMETRDISGLRGQLEGKLERRESPDALLARNILRASPITAGRVAAGAQELKWKQRADVLGAHLKDKISKPRDVDAEGGNNETSFSDRKEAIKAELNRRSPRTDLVKRGVIHEDDQIDSESTSSILPLARRPPSTLTPISPLPSPTSPTSHSPSSYTPYHSSISALSPSSLSPSSSLSLASSIPRSLSPTPPRSPATSPFASRRKRASSLIVPGSRSATPVQQDHLLSDGEPSTSSSSSHVRVTTRSGYSHLLSNEVRNAAYDMVSLQLSQNGMMVQRLEGEAGIPHICCTGDYVWVGYKSGTALAFQSICLEPNDELRHHPSSHSFIRALICVNSNVWCGYTSGEIQIWDGSGGDILHSIMAHPGVGVSALYFAEKSGCVWSGGGDGKVYVWNIMNRQCVRKMSQSHAGAVLVITQIGSVVWTMADSSGGAFLYDANDFDSSGANGNNIYNGNNNNNNNYSSSNGKHSARAGGLSPVPYARTPTPPPPRERKIRGNSGGLGAFSSNTEKDKDDKQDNKENREKEAEKDKEIEGEGGEMPMSVVHLGAGVLCLMGVPVYENNSSLLWAGTSDGQIRIVDPETKEVVRVLHGHTAKVNTMILVGAHVWSASNDKSIRIWSARGMEAIRTISDAHSSNIYALAQGRSTACYVWSAGSDRSVRVWLAAGAIELVGSFLESSLQGISELEAKQRKSEEKLAQSEALAKQSAEEISSLRLKIKTQVGEAMNARHEMELLAQEVASVDQWNRKMQALKAVYHSDKAVLKDKLAKAQDVIEEQDSELYDTREKLRETEAAVYRSQNDRIAIEGEAREMSRLLQKVESDYIARLQLLEKKEIEDAEIRRLLEIKLKEGHETEARLRQSILLLESRSKKSSSRPSSSLGKGTAVRGRSSTIGGGELPPLRLTPSPSLSLPSPLSSPPSPSLSPSQRSLSLSPSPTRPHIPRLALFGPKEDKDRDKEDREKEHDAVVKADVLDIEKEREREEREREEMGLDEEEMIGEDEDDDDDEEEDEEEEEEETADITVSLTDVLGMVKFKGERTTALHERILKLTSKIQQFHHQDHILQLQRLHHHQLEQVKKATGRDTERETETMGWETREKLGFVFLIIFVVMGIILFEMRNRIYFDSLHPS